MMIASIVCITFIVIVGIICYTIYKLKDVKQIEKNLSDIRYNLDEIKGDLNLYNRILNNFTNSSNKKVVKDD